MLGGYTKEDCVNQDRIVRLCGLKFKRQCSLDWDRLELTEDDQARHCTTCNREVYLCKSDEETMHHAELGHCIARATPSSSELPSMVLGEPDGDWLVANRPTEAEKKALQIKQREGNIARSLADLQFSARRCGGCGYPVADWLRSCGVCGSTRFRGVAT